VPFQLIPPGARKTVKGGRVYVNKFIVIRGSRNGVAFEHSAKTNDPAVAQQRGEELERDLATKQDDKSVPTFEEMVDLYIAAKQPGSNDRRYLRRLRSHFRGWLCTEIRSSDLAKAAHRLSMERSRLAVVM